MALDFPAIRFGKTNLLEESDHASLDIAVVRRVLHDLYWTHTTIPLNRNEQHDFTPQFRVLLQLFLVALLNCASLLTNLAFDLVRIQGAIAKNFIRRLRFNDALNLDALTAVS